MRKVRLINRRIKPIKGVRVNKVKVRIVRRSKNMDTVAIPMEFIPIIRADKFEEFMEYSKKKAVTQKEIDEIEETTKNIIQRPRRGNW